MQVDTQPFPVSAIELANKKVLVWPETADKGKGKNIVIGDPVHREYHKEGLLERLQTKRLTSPKALGTGSVEQPSKAP
jgi:hypothetical protein